MIDPVTEVVLDKTELTIQGKQHYGLNMLDDDSLVYHQRGQGIIYRVGYSSENLGNVTNGNNGTN